MLCATARERSRSGRTGIYDVEVTNGEVALVALFRGTAYETRGEVVAKASDRASRDRIVRARPPERHELDPIEIASRDEIAALQLARLQTTFATSTSRCRTTARRSIGPACTRTIFSALSDLARFPFTTKDDLRRHYPFGMFAVPRAEVVRVHASSGTTGRPTVVGYTRRDVEVWAQVCARSIRASGGRLGDIVHVVYGYGLFTGGLGAHYGAELLGCTVVPMSGGMTERQVQLITDFRPDIIMVTPSYLLAIADEFERQGIDAGRPRSGSGSAARSRGPRRCAGRSSSGSTSTRSTSTAFGGDRAGRGERVHRDQGRPARLGGSLLSGGRSTRRPARCCRTASAASWCSPR